MDIPDNFCGIGKDFSDYKKARAAIIPVPYEGTVTYGKGASKGPEAIIDASKNMETYDEELNKVICEIGISTLKPVKIEKMPEMVINNLYKEIKKTIEDRKFPVVLGGEHSISFGAVKAFKDKYPDLTVLQLDAHADLRDEYEGSKYSHACVMRRVLEVCPAVQVGIRSLSDEEAEFIKQKNIRIFYAKDIYFNSNWFDDVINRLSNNVYVTFDIDCLDPSLVPSTGTPEPGGLLWYPIIKFLRRLAQKKNIVGFDLVELSPIKDMSAPDFLAAKLIYKMIGYKFDSVLKK